MRARRGALVGSLTPRRRKQLAESLSASAGVQLALVGSGILAARGLGPAGRGDLALILLLPGVATQIVCLGVPAAATYFIASRQDVWRGVMRHLTPIALAQMVVALILLFALNWIFLADRSETTADAALVAAIGVPLLTGNFYALAVLQGLEEIRWFNVYRLVAPTAFALGLVALTLTELTLTACAVVWIGAQALVTSAMGIQLVAAARRHRTLGPGAAAPSRREMTRFGAAGFLAQVSPVETFKVDQLVTALFFSPQVLGYYVVASSVSNVPRFLADGIAAVSYPHVAGRSLRDGIAATWLYLVAAAVLCGVAAIGIAVTLPWIVPLLFGDAFDPAVSIGTILLIAAGLISIRRVGIDCLRALGRPGAATVNEVLKWAVLILAFLTLGRWGEGEGVALSLAVASAAALVFLVVILRRQLLAARSAVAADVGRGK